MFSATDDGRIITKFFTFHTIHTMSLANTLVNGSAMILKGPLMSFFDGIFDKLC